MDFFWSPSVDNRELLFPFFLLLRHTLAACLRNDRAEVVNNDLHKQMQFKRVLSISIDNYFIGRRPNPNIFSKYESELSLFLIKKENSPCSGEYDSLEHKVAHLLVI